MDIRTPIAYERPTLKEWKRTHATEHPVKYKAKGDTRRRYHWTVLTYLRYHPGLIGVSQPTWFGANGPTAHGIILSAWVSHKRHCYLVEAESKKGKDTYLVVFEGDGRFVTAYSKTRDDTPDKLHPVSVRNANSLLKLSLAVRNEGGRILDDDILKCLARKAAHNISKGTRRYKERVIPSGLKVGVIEEQDGHHFFTGDHVYVHKVLSQLNPGCGDAIQGARVEGSEGPSDRSVLARPTACRRRRAAGA